MRFWHGLILGKISIIYTMTTRVSAGIFAWELGITRISTLLPKALRNRKRRSVEKPDNLPRTNAGTFDRQLTHLLHSQHLRRVDYLSENLLSQSTDL